MSQLPLCRMHECLLFMYITILEESIERSNTCTLSEIYPLAFHSESVHWIVPLHSCNGAHTSEKYLFVEEHNWDGAFAFFFILCVLQVQR